MLCRCANVFCPKARAHSIFFYQPSSGIFHHRCGLCELRQTSTAFTRFPILWGVSRSNVQVANLRRHLSPIVSGQSVLDIGCGEGLLTLKVFGRAKSITGIDISNLAIDRARARCLSNARFYQSDFLDCSFRGYDLISALECLYYLNPEEQGLFFGKIADQHKGRLLVLSGPIIGDAGRNSYFTHDRLLRIFNALGFSLLGFHNLTVYWRPIPKRIVANLVKFPFGYLAVDWFPDFLIYQRPYIIRAPSADVRKLILPVRGGPTR
jgi:SAM-dependent methyltransferase